MAWLVALIIVSFLWNHLENTRNLREARRLLRRTEFEHFKPSPESPSPHQLLGEIARPLASSAKGCRCRGAAPDC